jgi:hypothetical protein
MGNTTKKNWGRASYFVKTDNVEVCVSVEGGMCTAVFSKDGKDIFPYFVTPWWEEGGTEDLPRIIANMRGDYFCLPFGINALPCDGVQHPLHGATTNECWDFVELLEEGDAKTLVLSLPFPQEEGSAEKRITLKKGEPIIYTKHIIRNFEGKTSVGHHPNLQCSDKQGCAIIDMTPPLTGFTSTAPIDFPENHYYSLLKPSVEFDDLKAVPTVYGDTVDLTRYPTPKGYADVVMLMSDPSNEFVFTSLTETEKGFLYFQLKDPKDLAATLLWMPNGGEHGFPWNGRVDSAIGIEEVTGNFFYGRMESVNPNPVQDKGYKTYLEFNKDKEKEIKLIAGLIPVDKSFTGVKDIIRKNDSEITIIGRNGENIDVPCSLDFL